MCSYPIPFSLPDRLQDALIVKVVSTTEDKLDLSGQSNTARDLPSKAKDKEKDKASEDIKEAILTKFEVTGSCLFVVFVFVVVFLFVVVVVVAVVAVAVVAVVVVVVVVVRLDSNSSNLPGAAVASEERRTDGFQD
jgi:Flp pilus assembly protein TadB